jgi:hypothetical protein
MRSFTLLMAACLLVPVATFAQQQWQHTYGSLDADAAKAIEQTSDGGYIVAGATYSFGAGACDFWLIKTDSLGDTAWTRAYGGTGVELGNSVRPTADGGYVVAGYTESFGSGDGDVWLIRTDSLGDTVWTRTYGGVSWDDCYSVRQTSDLGYILVGLTESYGAGHTDVWLIKTDSLGDTLWTRTYGGASFDEGHDVITTSDGGYIVAAATASFGAGAMDGWLVKTDSAGDTLWTQTCGGAGDDRFYSVAMTTGRGYILAGATDSHGAGGLDVWLVKTNASGDTTWTGTWGGAENEEAWSVHQTSDGGYVLAGYTESFGGGASDEWLIATNGAGDTLWTKTFGGSGAEEAFVVLPVADLGYVLAGTTTSIGAGSYDGWLIKTDPYGHVAVAGPRRSVPTMSAPVATIVKRVLALPDSPLRARYTLLSADGRFVCRLRPGSNDISGLRSGVYCITSDSGRSLPSVDIRKIVVTR